MLKLFPTPYALTRSKHLESVGERLYVRLVTSYCQRLLELEDSGRDEDEETVERSLTIHSHHAILVTLLCKAYE